MPPADPAIADLPRAVHAAELAGAGDAPEWVHLLPAGRFTGRDGRGPWTLSDAARVIEASRKQSPDGKLPIDYDHQSDFAARPGVGGTAPAAGWIVEFQERDDGVWARVEWTERARQAIAGREYRFLSPVFAHRKGGADVVAVLRASLTNTPNLDLTAVAARDGATLDDPTRDDGGTMDLAQLRQALGLAADAGDDAVLQAAKSAAAARDHLQRIAGTLGHRPDDDPARIAQTAASVQASANAVPKVAQALGLGQDAGAETVAAKAGELATAANSASQAPDPARYVPRDQHDQLAQRLSALETAQTTAAATQRADAAIEAGKVTPANRDWAITYASRDPRGFDQFVANQPAVLASGDVVPGGQPAGDAATTLTHTEKQVCAQMNLSEDEYLTCKRARAGGDGGAAAGGTP